MSAPRRSVQHDSSAEGDQAREQEQEQAQEQGAHAPQQEASSPETAPEGSYEISRVLEQGEDEWHRFFPQLLGARLQAGALVT